MVKYRTSTEHGRIFKFRPTKDPVMRTIIRKQAMLDAGRARRLRGDHGRINLGSGPPVICDCLTDGTNLDKSLPMPDSYGFLTPESDDTADDNTQASWGTDDQLAEPELLVMTPYPLCIDHILSLNPRYDHARSKFGVELRDLSLPTNFNTIKSRTKRLSADPQRLAVIMKHRHWSFLQFLPSFYDSNECVTAAADCLLAKVASILMPNTRDPEIEVRLYVRALRALQKAIEDPAHQFDVEVLCAIQLVSIRDLLEYRCSHTCDAWLSHIHGCAKLIQRRGAAAFKSEFEKALFAAHVGPVVSEAFKSNEPCYLEQPEWIELYRSLAIETGRVGHRNPITIQLRSLIFPFSRLWRDVHHAMVGKDVFNTDVLGELEERCRKLETWIIPCVKDCTDYFAVTPPSKTLESELCHRRALLVAAIDCLALVKRLLVTLCDSMRATLEAEVQGLAQYVFEIVEVPSAKRCWVLSQHRAARAHAVICTARVYAQAIPCEPWKDRRLRMRKCYLAWYRLVQTDVFTLAIRPPLVVIRLHQRT